MITGSSSFTGIAVVAFGFHNIISRAQFGNLSWGRYSSACQPIVSLGGIMAKGKA